MSRNLCHNLTPRQLAVLKVFEHFVLQKLPYSPSVREICDRLGLTVSTVQQHINVLAARGYLKKRVKNRRLPRNYFLTGMGFSATAGGKDL